MNKIDIALQYAWKFVGLPYRWGGDNSIEGFDCSGLVVEILKSVGILSRSSDYSAAGLYVKFSDKKVDLPETGCLVFWESNEKITHVEFCVDSFHTIGASGGGSSTTTLEAAEAQNAFIKVRPIEGGRKKYKYIVNPF